MLAQLPLQNWVKFSFITSGYQGCTIKLQNQDSIMWKSNEVKKVWLSTLFASRCPITVVATLSQVLVKRSLCLACRGDNKQSQVIPITSPKCLWCQWWSGEVSYQYDLTKVFLRKRRYIILTNSKEAYYFSQTFWNSEYSSLTETSPHLLSSFTSFVNDKKFWVPIWRNPLWYQTHRLAS